jgi:hypothetical protein
MTILRNTCPLLGLVALTVLDTAVGTGASADTTITGTYNGVDGADISGPGTDYGNGLHILVGNFGGSGVSAIGGTFLVHDATVTGGRGGMATGTAGVTYAVGGTGGYGLDIGSSVTTVNSGTFTGGIGGIGNGASPDYLAGGDGGDACYVNAATAVINGGTFTGAVSGGAGGSSPELTSEDGGDGLNANYGSVVTINGGSFTGGNGASITNASGSAYDGNPGSGVVLLSGTVNIYGGSFTGGAYDPTAPHGVRFAASGYGINAIDGSAILYGTNFTVNGVQNFTGSIPAGTGTITGRLLNNSTVTTITYSIDQYGNNSVTLVAAPEPSQMAAFGLGVLGVAALALKARRRKGVS